MDGRGSSRQRSPEDNGPESTKKRRRKVLSCIDCRRRKLLCDRGQPACGRCVKAGQASSCVYNEDAADGADREDLVPRATAFYGNGSRPTASLVQPSGMAARLEQQDQRIKQLEALLAQTSGSTTALQRLRVASQDVSPESATGLAEIAAPVREREIPLLRGGGFKTKFFGNTFHGGLLARIPEFRSFMRDTFESNAALSRISADMCAIDERVKLAKARDRGDAAVNLRELLPSKHDADALVREYFQNWGSLYQVLHLPSFWRDYEAMWSDVSAADEHFVALVLCIVACARCVTDVQPWQYSGDSSVAREKAVAAISAVENWLEQQSQKHLKAVDFQIRVLLLLAKQVSAHKLKRRWTEAGDLLRFCMGAGLHRNPDLLRKATSPLEKELRKRIWAAVTELELQAAFSQGMLSAPWILQSDTPAPAHIDDDDISADSDTLPAPLPASEFTPNSFLAIAAGSMTLRTTMNSNINSIRQSLTFEDVKRYTDEIDAHLQALPVWDSPDAAVASATLSLNLLQFLLVLHGRHVRLADSKAEQDYSRMIVLDTATRIIDIHQSVVSGRCRYALMMRNDPFRAALTICSLAATADPRRDGLLSTLVDQTRARVLPATLDMLSDCVSRLGSMRKPLWILAAAAAYVASLRDPARKDVYVEDAVKRIAKPLETMIIGQVERPDHALPTQRASGAQALLDASATTGPQSDALLPAQFSLDDLSAWTFDDFFVDPDAFGAVPAWPDFTMYGGNGYL